MSIHDALDGCYYYIYQREFLIKYLYKTSKILIRGTHKVQEKKVNM